MRKFGAVFLSGLAPLAVQHRQMKPNTDDMEGQGCDYTMSLTLSYIGKIIAVCKTAVE